MISSVRLLRPIFFSTCSLRLFDFCIQTIQSIASMSVFHRDWPLLVLTPSGARYHWESEFRNWLGVDGQAVRNAKAQAKNDEDVTPHSKVDGDSGFELLENSEIHVLTNSKADVFPNHDTRVVICSYGLAPMLIENGRIRPEMFGSAIADESHMLKNMKSKRTKLLVPILSSCKRCVLLSGTPALAKPVELWPQLCILGEDENDSWHGEQDFMWKYGKGANKAKRNELHTLMAGTIMIRRMKDDILRDMPRKAREKALIRISSPEMRKSMQECMLLLREGKGVMGKLAREHTAVSNDQDTIPANDATVSTAAHASGSSTRRALARDEFWQLLTGQYPLNLDRSRESILEQQAFHRYQQKRKHLKMQLDRIPNQLSQQELQNFIQEYDTSAREQLFVQYQEGFHALHPNDGGDNGGDSPPTRATVLNEMYGLTGKSKLPAITAFLKKWLEDPTKGKICVFAHHTYMLDSIIEHVRLSNSGEDGTYNYIRIDGKTTPRNRQENIDRFQTDAAVRIAVLGITAAGVAVTLTASAQVVFAELFWTPAM